MTYEEKVAHIRQVARTCKGHPIFPIEERRAYRQRWNAAEFAGDFDKAEALIMELEQRLGYSHAVVPQEWPDMLRRFAALQDTRKRRCGNDFNDVILAGPWDGQQHAYRCPKCGIDGTYIAPRFDD